MPDLVSIRSAAANVALMLVLTQSACSRTASVTPSPAEQRALLLSPANTFWQTHAPAVWFARVETTKGSFVVEIDRDWAPLGADRFYNLVRAGYYDDSRFTRVVPRYIAQFGIARDPEVNAIWSKAFFSDDRSYRHNARGTFGFAALGPNRRTTQIYINLVDNARVDPQDLGPIGRVVDGMDVVDVLYSGYGETAGGGIRAGKQGPLLEGGNAYIDREYPKLDRLIRIVVSDRR
ncbi:MAG TPA: peptidylprolyl isomerase [Gemmatimonadaceae bacterium]|jgi:homoserine O-acetyltransferase|nr:peptidylprolyl isomerase [Gemmatimonadaceae bacterium]